MKRYRLVYLQHSDPSLATRTWQQVMEHIVSEKHGSTQARWQCATRDKAFDLIRHRKVVETTSEHFLAVLAAGTVATNLYLRRTHCFAIGMHWLPWPILPKLHWPPLVYKPKRAITVAEHEQIVEREKNPELRAFFQMLWHTGGTQTDVANFQAEDMDGQDGTVTYRRRKTGTRVHLTLGREAMKVLETLPKSGPLFPRLAELKASERSSWFCKRLQSLNLTGIALHSYRYAWAERARHSGYPEQFAMQALGHQSEAVHRACNPHVRDERKDSTGRILTLPWSAAFRPLQRLKVRQSNWPVGLIPMKRRERRAPARLLPGAVSRCARSLPPD